MKLFHDFLSPAPTEKIPRLLSTCPGGEKFVMNFRHVPAKTVKQLAGNVNVKRSEEGIRNA